MLGNIGAFIILYIRNYVPVKSPADPQGIVTASEMSHYPAVIGSCSASPKPCFVGVLLSSGYAPYLSLHREVKL